MTSLYKYLPAKYVDSFIREGAVLFRSLSYFRDLEDAQVRGDDFEGTRLHRPQSGLEVTLVKTQQKISLAHSFESTANEDDIFVFCFSTRLSTELATQFKAEACIEITNLGAFVAGVRSALLRRPSIKTRSLYTAKSDTTRQKNHQSLTGHYQKKLPCQNSIPISRNKNTASPSQSMTHSGLKTRAFGWWPLVNVLSHEQPHIQNDCLSWATFRRYAKYIASMSKA